MKKLSLFLLLGFFAVLFQNPPLAQAVLSCPSAETTCSSLDAQGGCPSTPCLRVVTQQGSPRGGPAMCQCQLGNFSDGRLSVGQVCQRDADCQSGYCWGILGQAPTCKTQSRAEAQQNAQGTKNDVGCEGNIEKGINTALGCIPINDQNKFMSWILGWAIGIGGGIAFLLILFAGFQIMTSQGDPKKLQAGQELLTSAIGGLILLIFSVFILRFIGVDILGIPGLSTQ